MNMPSLLTLLEVSLIGTFLIYMLLVTFDTTNGSTTVAVNCTAHGAIQGDFVTFSGTTGDPGGIPNADLDNEFEIQAVTGPNEFTILSPKIGRAHV